MQSEIEVITEHEHSLVPLLIRVPRTTFIALKAESRATAVPVSVMVRQIVAAWLNHRTAGTPTTT